MLKILKKIGASVLILASLLSLFVGCKNEAEQEQAEFRNLKWAVSAPLPEAMDFVVSLPEGAEVRFAEEYQFLYLGEYTLELILRRADGSESTHAVKLDLAVDVTPPEILGLTDLVAYINGDGISYLSGVTTADDCDGKVTLSVDTSAVDLHTVGIYPVTYTAVDSAGNVTRLTVSLAVYEQEITEEMLYELLDREIASIISASMTKEQKVRAVYNYVYDNVYYTNASDKSSWVRAAYEGLTQREGDCFTYFALAKAFFERLGIENKDIQRKQSVVAQVGERHFWSLVNLGSADAPVWYHFDATHLIDMPKPWGCLMTDDQLAAYSAQRSNAQGVTHYFYAYDAASYPATAREEITAVN